MSTRLFIKSLEVVTSQRRASSSYEPNRREFVEGLNLLIGPPGSGKSTVIELIRFGLGMNARKTPVVEKVYGVYVEVRLRERLLLLYRSTLTPSEVHARDMSLDRDIGAFPVTSKNPDETTIGKQLMVWLGLPPDVEFTSSTGQRKSLSFEHVWEYVHVPQTDIDQRIARHDAPGLTPRRMRLFQLLFDLIDGELQRLEQSLLEAKREQDEAKSRQEGVLAFTERASLPSTKDLREKLSEALQRRERLSESLAELRSAMGTRDDRVLTLRGMLEANRNNTLRTQAALRELAQVQEDRQERANGLRRSLERLQRLHSANDLLAPIEFSQCPRCMQDIDGRHTPAGTCRLCLQPEPSTEEDRGKTSPDGELPILIPGESSAQEVQLAAQQEEILSLINQAERERQTLRGHLDELGEGNREIREEIELLTGTGGPHVEELSRLTAGLARVDGEVDQLRRSLDIDRQVASFRDDFDQAVLETRAAQENKKEHETRLRHRAQDLFARLSRSYDDLLHDLGTPNAVRGEISSKDYLPHIDDKRFDRVNLSGGNQIPFIVGYWLTLHEKALANPRYLLPSCLILDSPQKSLGPLQPLSHGLYEQFRRITENSARPFQLFVLDTDLPGGFDPGSSLIRIDYSFPGIPGVRYSGPENQPQVEDMEDW